jgi:hypothetical protein
VPAPPPPAKLPQGLVGDADLHIFTSFRVHACVKDGFKGIFRANEKQAEIQAAPPGVPGPLSFTPC